MRISAAVAIPQMFIRAYWNAMASCSRIAHDAKLERSRSRAVVKDVGRRYQFVRCRRCKDRRQHQSRTVATDPTATHSPCSTCARSVAFPAAVHAVHWRRELAEHRGPCLRNCCWERVNCRRSLGVGVGRDHVDPDHCQRFGEPSGRLEVFAVQLQCLQQEVRRRCERKRTASPVRRQGTCTKSLDPKSQIGTSSPSPGTARTACPGSALRK